jgi:hypothetical protein
MKYTTEKPTESVGCDERKKREALEQDLRQAESAVWELMEVNDKMQCCMNCNEYSEDVHCSEHRNCEDPRKGCGKWSSDL